MKTFFWSYFEMIRTVFLSFYANFEVETFHSVLGNFQWRLPVKSKNSNQEEKEAPTRLKYKQLGGGRWGGKGEGGQNVEWHITKISNTYGVSLHQ
jgi:hypothetical protein